MGGWSIRLDLLVKWGLLDFEVGSSILELLVKWGLLAQTCLCSGVYCMRYACEVGSFALDVIVKWGLLH